MVAREEIVCVLFVNRDSISSVFVSDVPPESAFFHPPAEIDAVPVMVGSALFNQRALRSGTWMEPLARAVRGFTISYGDISGGLPVEYIAVEICGFDVFDET